jgi:hypothetical protein
MLSIGLDEPTALDPREGGNEESAGMKLLGCNSDQKGAHHPEGSAGRNNILANCPDIGSESPLGSFKSRVRITRF